MSWYYLNSEVIELPENVVGFVYQITNLTTNRKYIGKKLANFSKTKTRTVKLKSGEKRKKKIRTKEESDWREYWSSSEELKKDVAELGQQNFRRDILHFCNSKGMLSYMELKEQVENRVLERDDFYNGIIQCRIGKNHLK
jgi:predicted DNA-binding antitoxin AbrB/MazE fold protein